MIARFLGIIYKTVIRSFLFKFDPEFIHNVFKLTGENLGKIKIIKKTCFFLFSYKSNALKQNIFGVNFKSPIGLAAGFDYDGELTQILPSLGFGFETIGTITNLPYEGNPKPRLGRLPKSKSLMVNKGFKNKGALKISKKLSKLKFEIPLGISIGKTNIKSLNTQKSAIDDTLQAFHVFENSNIKNAYYELNISCPNLYGNITFYPPKNLDELLKAVDALNIKKPIFIKMPIDKTNEEILKMLGIIRRHKIKGVIFGNLQKNRNDSSLFQDEVKKFEKGYFSGKPTEKRSNELIALTYKHYKDKLVIIGCGGVFNAKDAYKKIKLGASLVQLITGLIYEGPFLIAQINSQLPKLLKKDGFKNINEAIGVENKTSGS